MNAAPTMKPTARTASVVDAGTVFGGAVGIVLRQASRMFRIEYTNTRTSTEANVIVWRKIGTSANPVRPSPRSPEKRTRNTTLITAATTYPIRIPRQMRTAAASSITARMSAMIGYGFDALVGGDSNVARITTRIPT